MKRAISFREMPEPEPYPDRSQAILGAGLTWAHILAEEPRLKSLAAQLKAVDPGDNPNFCANAVWYGYGKPHNASFRNRMMDLVGWHAANPALRSEAAYMIAYEKLYNMLPDCRRCLCA